jgi:predicted nucleic acid-binding Zn ribbon protein
MEEQEKNCEQVTPVTPEPTSLQEEQPEIQSLAEKKFCTKCGAELAIGQQFCSKCGQPVGQPIVNPKEKTPNKVLFGIIGGIAAIVLIVAIVVIARGTQAKSITLNKDSISVKVDETATLTYTIDPDDAKNKTVTWESSNESIASVNNGIITGLNEGDCTITVTTKNGKTDTCEITVLPAGPDFLGLFDEYCDSTWASVGSDGSYLSIDTNPDDEDDTGIAYWEAYLAIESVNEALGLPEYLSEDMSSTTSLMGRQSQDFDDVTVSWTYHPDHGLEVTYKAK